MANNRDNQAGFGNVVGGITVIVGVLVALYFIVLFALKIAAFIGAAFSKWGTETDPELIAVIVGVFLTYLFTNFSTKIHNQKRAEEQAKLRKIDIYNEFISSLTEMLRIREERNEPVDENDMGFITKFATQLIIHSGTDVIKSFWKWKDAEEKEKRRQSLLSADNLLRAIRKDLGVNNKGIKAKELLGCIFIGGKSAIDEQIADADKQIEDTQ